MRTIASFPDQGSASHVDVRRVGRLIALEGGESSGKSTQAALLASRLGALLTREPGGCELGERVRSMLLGSPGKKLAARAEALLFLAARAQHVTEVVQPALAAGGWVVVDRFAGSTLAYQGYGAGLDLAELEGISQWAAGGVAADMFVLIDISLELLNLRAAAREAPPDRFESEDSAFHERVLAGYREIARSDPEHWVVVDGAGSVDEVAVRVLAEVVDRLGAPHGGHPLGEDWFADYRAADGRSEDGADDDDGSS